MKNIKIKMGQQPAGRKSGKSMKWIKKGLIIKPGLFPWMVTHAQNPFVKKIQGDEYRIYFAGRDDKNMARGGYAEININRPEKILHITKKPVLDLGDLGCFDDCGAMPSCIVSYRSKQYMYYTGWTQARATPFSFFIGLAISRDNGRSFTRYSKAPVLGRNFYDPYLTCSPWLIIESGIWRMWYVSGTGWERGESNSKPKHYYRIVYAESNDGLNWNSRGKVCIDYRGSEYAIARPVVYKENGIYKMWYCYRGGTDTYRAGYAESRNGLDWVRKDAETNIDVSESGWDAEMICYPYVFSHNGKSYMLYNGNGYGATGCGFAILNENE